MRSSRRSVLAFIAAVAVIAAMAAVIVQIQSSKQPVDTATVYSGDLAAVAVAVTLLLAIAGWWRKNSPRAGGISSAAQVAAAAERLAQVMADRWRREAAIRRITTPAPITVRWHWAAEAVTAPRRDVATPPVPGAGPLPLPAPAEQGELLDSGVVGRLHDELYARLPHGRLVVLGGPGAGKTGAMVLLLLAALEQRALLVDGQRERVPVPVWLTMGKWNPADMSLREWAAATMNRDHPALRAPEYGPDAAEELLRGARVALFLDGLDEMPEGVRAQAMRRVDEEARGLRVVLTSRPAEFWHATQDSRPDNTAVIELRPVRPGAAAAYLLHGQPHPHRERWELLGSYLKQHPGSVAAHALDNPLTLSAARDTYAAQDPVVLTDADRFPSVHAVREHLLSQLLVTAYADEHQRAHATRWLAWIAGQMDTSRDLSWWEIPAWVPLWKLRLVFGIAAGLLFGLAAGLAIAHVADSTAGLVAGIAAGSVIRRLRRAWHRACAGPSPSASCIRPALATTTAARLDTPIRPGSRAHDGLDPVAVRRARSCAGSGARLQGRPRVGVRLRGRIRIRARDRARNLLWLRLHHASGRLGISNCGQQLRCRPSYQRHRRARDRIRSRDRSWVRIRPHSRDRHRARCRAAGRASRRPGSRGKGDRNHSQFSRAQQGELSALARGRPGPATLATGRHGLPVPSCRPPRPPGSDELQAARLIAQHKLPPDASRTPSWGGNQRLRLFGALEAVSHCRVRLLYVISTDLGAGAQSRRSGRLAASRADLLGAAPSGITYLRQGVPSCSGMHPIAGGRGSKRGRRP